MRTLLTLVALLAASPAAAADRTSTPPWLRADIDVAYRGAVDLSEVADRVDSSDSFQRVGNTLRQQHDVGLDATFSVYHGVALALRSSGTFYERRQWFSARAMRYDLDAGAPTMVDGPALDPGSIKDRSAGRLHNGFGDMEFGVRVVPFAPGMPDRDAPAALAFDFRARIPSGGNHDKVRPNGASGIGEGGPGFVLGVTGSRRMGVAEPWVSATWRFFDAYAAPLVDHEGNPLSTADEDGNTRLDPADEVELGFGAEIYAAENAQEGTSSRVEVAGLVTYRGPDEISSGTRLPAPLASSQGRIAVTGEHLLVEGLLGLRIRPVGPIEIRFDLQGGWMSPHTLEQVSDTAYRAQSGAASFRIRAGLGARIRIR